MPRTNPAATTFPADSLQEQLADVSQESFEECLPSRSPSVEATDRSAPALRFHEGGISSSHLETVPAPTEHGLDSARSSFPRESEPSAGKGASVTQRSSSPIGREPATPASVSPITSPAGSQRGRASSRSVSQEEKSIVKTSAHDSFTTPKPQRSKKATRKQAHRRQPTNIAQHRVGEKD